MKNLYLLDEIMLKCSLVHCKKNQLSYVSFGRNYVKMQLCALQSIVNVLLGY